MPAEKSGVTVNVAMMSYKPYSAPLKAGESFVEIKIERSARELKQIVVKSSRIRENGDTVTYNVGAFARKQDRTIGDVLRRMPGIDVSDNGSSQNPYQFAVEIVTSVLSGLICMHGRSSFPSFLLRAASSFCSLCISLFCSAICFCFSEIKTC